MLLCALPTSNHKIHHRAAEARDSLGDLTSARLRHCLGMIHTIGTTQESTLIASRPCSRGMRLASAVPGAAVMISLVAAGPWLDALQCFESASRAISQTPDMSEDFMTTTRLFKSHLAEFFCSSSERRAVLELGVHEGFTTQMLSSIFGRVLAIDHNETALELAAASLATEASNVVYLMLDLTSPGWPAILRKNAVDAVIVDAGHAFEDVVGDTLQTLRNFATVKHVVFDDYYLPLVQAGVHHLASIRAIVDCMGIGYGFDGSVWHHPHLAWRDSWRRGITTPEGLICGAGSGPL